MKRYISRRDSIKKTGKAKAIMDAEEYYRLTKTHERDFLVDFFRLSRHAQEISERVFDLDHDPDEFIGWFNSIKENVKFLSKITKGFKLDDEDISSLMMAVVNDMNNRKKGYAPWEVYGDDPEDNDDD